LDAGRNDRALQFSAKKMMKTRCKNSIEAAEKMRDENFFIFVFGFPLHFLLDKIIECHYTLTEHALRQLLAGANSRRLRGE